MDKQAFRYHGWLCIPTLIGTWLAFYPKKLKAKRLYGVSKKDMRRAINKHRMTWKW